AALAHPRRELIVYSQPFAQCPPCRAMFNTVGDGDALLHLEWIKADLPRWVTATPTVYDPVTKRYRVGVCTLADLHAWIGVPAPSTGARELPSTMGTVHGIDAIVDALRSAFGDMNVVRLEHGGNVAVGSVTVVLPSPTIVHWDLTGPVQRLTFDGQ